MIGIHNIGCHIAPERVSNFDKTEKHGITEAFITEKIGMTALARKQPSEMASDLCVLAYENLIERIGKSVIEDIEFLCVCTQNGDYRLPHTSAIVQAELGAPKNCAAFDISLGCSGYVYSLHIAKSFMESNGLKKGLLFTSDPYSNIIDTNDKNTDLLFGDGATATYLTVDPVFEVKKGIFGTDGSRFDYLIKRKNESLVMKGRGIFEFTMKEVPGIVDKCIETNGFKKEDIDLFLLHQASKYIVDNLCRRIKLQPEKTPFAAEEYGNTISSSIPVLLKDYMEDTSKNYILICGFGVGLSFASSILRRI